MMRLSTPASALLSALAGTVFLLLYGPLVIPIASSFFEVAHGNVQWHHPSLSSYAQLATNAGIIEACKNTFIVGVSASLLALICGTLFGETGLRRVATLLRLRADVVAQCPAVYGRTGLRTSAMLSRN